MARDTSAPFFMSWYDDQDISSISIKVSNQTGYQKATF
nr:MAG TPA: hypothetical protein [Caudoviricetes sp.]